MYRVASYIHHGFSGTCFADHWSALCAGVILDSSVSLSLSVLLYGAVDLGLVWLPSSSSSSSSSSIATSRSSCSWSGRGCGAHASLHASLVAPSLQSPSRTTSCLRHPWHSEGLGGDIECACQCIDDERVIDGIVHVSVEKHDIKSHCATQVWYAGIARCNATGDLVRNQCLWLLSGGATQRPM